MMHINDFRYMRRGKQCAYLGSQDIPFLAPVSKKTSGKKRALLALHGFSSSPAVFRYLIPEIHGYDAIFCPVLPGHGESIAAFGQVTHADWIHATHQAYQELAEEYGLIDVLGLSLGGLLACELSQHVAINHLFLLAPALVLKMNIPMMLTLAYGLSALGFRYLRNAAGNIISNETMELSYRQLPIRTIITMLELVQQFSWVPPTCPIDLFLGADDAVVSSAKVATLFAPLAQAKIHWLEQSAHVIPIDNDRNVVSEVMMQYLS